MVRHHRRGVDEPVDFVAGHDRPGGVSVRRAVEFGRLPDRLRVDESERVGEFVDDDVEPSRLGVENQSRGLVAGRHPHDGGQSLDVDADQFVVRSVSLERPGVERDGDEGDGGGVGGPDVEAVLAELDATLVDEGADGIEGGLQRSRADGRRDGGVRREVVVRGGSVAHGRPRTRREPRKVFPSDSAGIIGFRVST